MSTFDDLIQKRRVLSSPVAPFIHHRWSPRSMSGESLTKEEINGLFEAARLAPSSYNAQPWRFVYATKTDASWSHFMDLLVDFNKQWCKNAGLLVIVASRKNFEHNEKPSQTHSYDAGASWMSLALQGAHQGLVVHGLQGFDYEKAATLAHIPSEYQVEAMIAVGRPAPKDQLPPDLQAMEIPSERRPLSEILFHGQFS
ncbi:MAG: nitroreductase family protein [Chlamydiae bacterium]|nr:nitroreductase family protein [Chlamydiota bacterium]